MRANLNALFQSRPAYAVAAFNVYGYEDAAPVVEAAEELGEPVILMANRDAVAHMPSDMFAAIMGKLADNASVPIAIHLDHSVSFEAITMAVEGGFTSVMFDGSQLPMDENIAATRRVVEFAHPKDVSVEGEIGSVGYSDPAIAAKTVYTEPEDAVSFAAQTGVDCLAVSVGTLHRMVTQEARLQFDRLAAIRSRVDTPLVIHGSTGVADADLARLSRSGARKINIGTSLRMVFGQGLRKAVLDRPDEFDRIKLFVEPMRSVREKAREKMLALRVN